VAKNQKLALTATGTGLNTGNTGLNHWILLEYALKKLDIEKSIFVLYRVFFHQKTIKHR